MALTAARGPLLSALGPTRGQIRWLAARLAVVVFSSLPALVAGLAGVSGGLARRPYYTEVDGRLPLAHLSRLLRDLPGAFVPAAIIGVVLALLADQLLTAGAIVFFDPARAPEERGKVSAAALSDGLRHLWPFLRIIGLSLVLWGVGIGLVRVLSRRLDIMAYSSGWTGATAALRLPALSALLLLVWVASVGAWAFWCRLLTVADGRRRVRRTGLLALRVFRSYPLRSWGVYVLSTIVVTLASGAVLVAWRQAEPRTVAGALGWALVWLGSLFAQAFVWLWLLRAGRLLLAAEDLATVRSAPDDPFGLPGKLLWWRRKGGDGPREGAPGAPGEPPGEIT